MYCTSQCDGWGGWVDHGDSDIDKILSQNPHHGAWLDVKITHIPQGPHRRLVHNSMSEFPTVNKAMSESPRAGEMSLMSFIRTPKVVHPSHPGTSH